jgi:hypothetical protein
MWNWIVGGGREDHWFKGSAGEERAVTDENNDDDDDNNNNNNNNRLCQFSCVLTLLRRNLTSPRYSACLDFLLGILIFKGLTARRLY